ncbi:hypothetical protein HDU87_008078 [Geranomyces variabilis]|uniref:Uncharacterized protein n=1 Tax=Geranomyces variabilis TaxID=109894 RepID=A0AAD5TP78_9FUNG|nr:hypothetical protein HDU87_008078 [Geranomyces variabilis]
MAFTSEMNCPDTGGSRQPGGPYSKAGRVGRRLIVYLEPSPATPLRAALDAFRELAAERWTPTDAHAYHPHCSITGFWETVPAPPAARPTQDAGAVAVVVQAISEVSVGDDDDDDKDQVQQQQLQRQDAGNDNDQPPSDKSNKTAAAINHTIANATAAATTTTTEIIRFAAPTVNQPLISPRNRTSLVLPLVLSPALARLAVCIPALLAESGIFVNRPAPKRCDHISMAYYADEDGRAPGGPQTEERARRAEEMSRLAAEVLANVFKGRESGVEMAVDEWDLVLYELVKEERNPGSGGVHVFRELGRWRVV